MRGTSHFIDAHHFRVGTTLNRSRSSSSCTVPYKKPSANAPAIDDSVRMIFTPWDDTAASFRKPTAREKWGVVTSPMPPLISSLQTIPC